LAPEGSQREQGKQYLAAGKTHEAKAIFADLAKREPKDAEILVLLAIASLKLREAQAAELYLRQALAAAPNHAEARTLLGWIELEVRRDYDGAVAEYAKVVELRPEAAEAYNNLGVALRKKGQLEKAVTSFDRALELRADYREARSNRGWVYVEQKRWQEARRDFEEVLKLDAEDEAALYGLSRVLKEARDYAGADRALRSLVARSPNFVYWLEWGQLQLARYYWVLLLIAVALFAHAQHRKRRREAHGG
jgi:tetratricopeptide (TPR) repeat protein